MPRSAPERRVFSAAARLLRNYAPRLRLRMRIRNGADIDAPRGARRCRGAMRPPAKNAAAGRFASSCACNVCHTD